MQCDAMRCNVSTRVSDTSRWCRVHRVGRRSARSEAAGAGRTHTQDDDEHEVDVRKAVKLLEKIDRDERQVPERVLGRPNVVVLAGSGGVAVARVKRTKGQASEGEKITSDESPGTTRRRSESEQAKGTKNGRCFAWVSGNQTHDLRK
jgi:hypothetical protein